MKISIFTSILSLLVITGNYAFTQTPVIINIDMTKGLKPVSPFIYGKNNVLPSTFLSTGTTAEIKMANEAGVRFVRQGGGNNATKYNWRNKLSSHPDWYNNVYSNDWDGAAKNMLDKMPGVSGMWSFQLLGKAASNTIHNFNDNAYNGSQWWAGVNQNLAGGGKPNTVDPSGKALVEGNPDLYLETWSADSTVGILDKWFGAKGLGYDKKQIQYWDMDNEPEIWSGTHDDVMKTQCTAEEFMQLYFKVAKAARAKYPTIKLVGPVPANEWQWYNWSGGSKINGVNYPWLEFFIKRIAEEEKTSGIKLLDVLDIHSYPGESDAATCVQLHRLFFDRTYVYPGANGVKTVTGGWDASINKEYILGRCADWLTKYMGVNHGVTLGVTETDNASTNSNIQAVWYASVMGEFMKQGVEIFTPWSWKVGMWETLHLMSRYDLPNYVQATSADETTVSAYPTVNNSTDSMSVVLVNRSLTDTKQVSLNFTGFTFEDRAYSMYTLSKLTNTETFVSHTKNALVKSDVTAQNNQITLDLAPLSVNTLLLKRTTPVFAAISPYCEGSIMTELPTTSINGISGTWYPTLNNMATIEYTFTPIAGQSTTSTVKMIITIDPPVIPTFAVVGPYCPDAIIAELPTTSTNGFTGSWTPAINNLTTTEYSFTPTAGQCATTTTLTITIGTDLIPEFDIEGPYCAGAMITALPTISLNGINGTWSPALNNTTTTEYTFTPILECALTSRLTISIDPQVIPTFLSVGSYCTGVTIAALPTSSLNGVNGLWSPALNNTTTTEYTFTPTAGQCATTTKLTIIIDPQVIPTFLSLGSYCTGAMIAALPTSSLNGISGAWSPALNNALTTKYTFVPTVGQCATTATLTIIIDAKVIPTFTAVGSYSEGVTIAALPTTSLNSITGKWAPDIDNMVTTIYAFTPDDGQCSLSTTLTITIETGGTGIEINTENNSFKVFPTSFDNQINIQSDKAIQSISIYNLLGFKIKTVNPNSTKAIISLEGFTSGTYLVKVDKQTAVKVIKK